MSSLYCVYCSRIFPGIHIIRWGLYLTMIKITRSAQIPAHITQKIYTLKNITLKVCDFCGWNENNFSKHKYHTK